MLVAAVVAVGVQSAVFGFWANWIFGTRILDHCVLNAKRGQTKPTLVLAKLKATKRRIISNNLVAENLGPYPALTLKANFTPYS